VRIARCANLPVHFGDLYITMSTDARSLQTSRFSTFMPPRMHRVRSAGHSAWPRYRRRLDGTVDDLSRMRREAIRILNGEPPPHHGAPQGRRTCFDGANCGDGGFEESSAGVVLFRSPTLWSAYRGTVLAAS
jgi:hypothetical protein